MNGKTRNMVLSALFIAFGIILPQIFHVIGAGSVFLPMHIPVLVGAFFLPPVYALLVGAVTPLLSSLFFGMPPLFPVLCYMLPELAAYGLFTALSSQKLEGIISNIYIKTYAALITGMIMGRVLSGISVWLLVLFFGAQMPGPFTFITGSIVTGLPGIIIQLLFIPLIAVQLQRILFKKGTQAA